MGETVRGEAPPIIVEPGLPVFDQVNLIQGECPIVVNQFIPAPYQSSLSGMRTHIPRGTAPAIALDISASEAVALIHD